MLGFGKEKRQVVAAVAYDEHLKSYTLVFNPKWVGYSFPTKSWPDVRVSDDVQYRRICEETALSAFEEDLRRPFPDAQAIWVDFLEIEGTSGRTGKRTRYSYDIVWVGPGETLPAGGFGEFAGALTREQILGNRHVVTWSTRAILRELLEQQQAAVGVICRQHNGQREYLLTLNRYGRYFFPSKRLRRSVSPWRALVSEFRESADFNGRIDPGTPARAAMTQTTAHLGDRDYLFHIYPMKLPDVDLSAKNNNLEVALAKVGIVARWFGEDELKHPAPQVSDTIIGILPEVLALPC
jgi:hypothetical protein